MKNHRLLLASLFLGTAAFGFAANAKPAPKPDAAPAAKSKADAYPLKTCVVSDEALGDDFITFTYQQPGKPDRVVRFCCDGCIDDFKADPAKFLKKLDDAQAAAKAAPAKKS